MIRIIAHRVAKKGTPTWDARSEDGTLLCPATEHPFSDGAMALLDLGYAPETLVTMAHAGGVDAFVPCSLSLAAAPAIRRVAKAKRADENKSARNCHQRRVRQPWGKFLMEPRTNGAFVGSERFGNDPT